MEKKQNSSLLLTAGRFFSALFLCFALSPVFAPDAFAAEEDQEPQKQELYQWKDDRGIVHITDDAGKIPKKYRSRAEKLESVKSTEPAPFPTEQGVRGGPAPQIQEEQAEDLQRALWQRRLKEWRDKLADAETRLRELRQKREEALRRGGGPAVSGRLEGVQEAERIEQEMKTVQREIDEARNQIEVVIPEDARKKGVPPEWLRE